MQGFRAMVFDSFQNDTATLKAFGRDFGGNASVVLTFDVKCDVQFQVKRTTNSAGEEINTFATAFITPKPELDKLPTYDQWQFEYDGVQYQVERFKRVRYPASSAISHYELELR